MQHPTGKIEKELRQNIVNDDIKKVISKVHHFDIILTTQGTHFTLRVSQVLASFPLQLMGQYVLAYKTLGLHSALN